MKDNGQFFTNDRIVIGSDNNERITSPANTRPSSQSKFKAPEHTIGSKNLLVFVDGVLMIPNRDYKDTNSNEISFVDPVPPNKDVDIVLTMGGTGELNIGYWGEF